MVRFLVVASRDYHTWILESLAAFFKLIFLKENALNVKSLKQIDSYSYDDTFEIQYIFYKEYAVRFC